MAHELFHVHNDEVAMDAADCPIRAVPLAGGTYSSDKESFRRKDGRLIRVSASSSPLREEGEITGSAALFRDISAEHNTRMRLQQSDIAFRNLAEAVLLTDSSVGRFRRSPSPGYCGPNGRPRPYATTESRTVNTPVYIEHESERAGS